MSTEDKVIRWLKARGFEVVATKGPFDCVINGKRVEIKCADLGSYIQPGNYSAHWSFNIHRHNKVDESQVDVYVFRLDGVPGFKSAIHLIIPAPLNTKNIHITFRSLMTKWGQFFNRFDLLR